MVTQVKTLEFTSLSDYVKDHQYNVSLSTLDDKGWSLADERTSTLFAKIKAKGVPLKDYVGGKIYRGVLTGLNEAFVIDKTTRERLIAEDARSTELIKPFLAGRDIKRYQTRAFEKYLIFTRHGVNIKDYPAIERHLHQYKEKLMPKPRDWKGDGWNGRKPGAYRWYEVQDTIDYYSEFEKPKIVYAEIATKGQFTLDSNGYFYDTTSYIMGSDSKYLMGILNSRLWTFMFLNVSSTIRGGFFRWKRQYMAPLSIHSINFSDPNEKDLHDRMITLVDGMLALHKQLANVRAGHERTAIQRQIEATDRQIDNLVYELYGLTKDEIKIVDEALSPSNSSANRDPVLS